MKWYRYIIYKFKTCYACTYQRNDGYCGKFKRRLQGSYSMYRGHPPTWCKLPRKKQIKSIFMETNNV